MYPHVTQFETRRRNFAGELRALREAPRARRAPRQRARRLVRGLSPAA